MLHVVRRELLHVRILKVVIDVGQIEILPILLSGRVEAPKIAYALLINQCAKSPARDARRTPLGGFPLRIDSPISDDENVPLSLFEFPLSLESPKEQRGK